MKRGILLIDMSRSMVRDRSRLEILRSILEEIDLFSDSYAMEVIGYRTRSCDDNNSSIKKMGPLDEALLEKLSDSSMFGGNSPLGEALTRVSDLMSKESGDEYVLIILLSCAGDLQSCSVSFQKDLYRKYAPLLDARKFIVTLGSSDGIRDLLIPYSDGNQSLYRSTDFIDWVRVFS